MNRFSLCLLALLLAANAQSEQLQLVGQARLEVLFWSIYDSRLYTADGSYTDGQRPLRLELEYLRDIEAADLVEHTRSEWQHLQLHTDDKDLWLQELARMWPDVRKDDVLALEMSASGRSTFLLNGKPLGSIDDPEFGPSFLAIWLSPDTSRPELRRLLIGMN
jgi:hypothetical protein